jgi:two-component system sensor histidine kinase DegS
MNKSLLDIEYLDEVINSTIDAIEKGQKEIYNIFEHSKQECERIEKGTCRIEKSGKANNRQG